MAYEFRLPDIGEGLHEAEVLRWFVEEGQPITADERLAELQTDKAAVEITSPVGGTVLSRCGPVGATVRVGEVLVAIDAVAGAMTGAQKVMAEAAQSVTATDPVANPLEAEQSASGGLQASPAVRKLARDLGVNLTKVSPTGSNQRITRADVERAAQEPVKHEWVNPPAGAPASAGNHAAERREPIRGLRKRIYENMARSMSTAPQATGMADLNATNLVALRNRLLPFAERQQVKLTYLPIIVKAAAQVLREFPIFNASVDDERMEIVYKSSINIGIATATADGLVVPVIHDADKKSVLSIALELGNLVDRARNRKLTLSELSGGTFTISSTGPKGGWFATPIVNYLEVAILGVHSIEKRAVVLEDDSIVAQPRMSFSLTFDHRVIDGEPAGMFMYRFAEYLENPETVLAM